MFLAIKVKHPKLVNVSAVLPLAIAQLEARADFSAPLAVNAHNFFGMKYPEGRVNAHLSTAVGKTASGFAIYRSEWGSIDDFMFWLEFRNLTSDALLDDYIQSGKYCPDKGYYQHYTAIANALRPTMLNPSVLALDVALGGAALALAFKTLNKALK